MITQWIERLELVTVEGVNSLEFHAIMFLLAAEQTG